MARFSVKVTNRSAFPSAPLADLFRACLRAHGVPAQSYSLEVLPSYHAGMGRPGGRALAAAGRARVGQVRGDRFAHGTKVWMAAPHGEGSGGRRIRAASWHLDPSTPRGFCRWTWVLDHEVKHLVGWTDPELDKSHDPQIAAAMGEKRPEGADDLAHPPAWAKGFATVEPKPAKPGPTADDLARAAEARREKRIAHAEAMLAKAERHAAQAEKRVTRWKRKLAGLTRAALRLAASKEPTP